MKSKTTRRALLSSCVALMLCFSMLLGTTYAWFTDSVTSANNIIVAGNLDVELYYKNDETSEWTKVNEQTNIFKENTLWEPGHTEVVKLKVVNEGTLALKYQLSVNVASETGSVNVYNNPFELSDYIKFGILEGEPTYTRDEAVAAVDATATALKEAYNSEPAKLETDKDQIVTMVVYMPTTVENDANYAKGEAVPEINLGLNLLATQVEAELDSFGDNYDTNAWTEVAEIPNPDAEGVVNVYTAEQLAGVMSSVSSNSGIKTINIKDNINLSGRTWAPAYVSAPNLVINGNGHTIFNMTTNGKDYQGFIGVAYQNITINDLTFENAVVKANKSFDGTVIGWAWGNADVTFNNVDVVDSEVSATLANKSIRVGGLIGFFPYDGGNLTLKDCDVSGSTITGYHNVGAMVGTTLTQKTVTIENCTAKNNTLVYGSPNVGAFDFGASDSGYNAYVPASGFTAENNEVKAVVEATVSTADELIAAWNSDATSISLELANDIELDERLNVAEGKEVYLDMNGKKITTSGTAVDPVFYTYKDSKLIIDGNGTVELTDPSVSLLFPGGDVVIENGNFIRNVPAETPANEVGALIVGAKVSPWGSQTVTINGGYFDGGYYDENAADVDEILAGTKTLSETADDIANRGKYTDKNAVRVAIKNNTQLTLNLSYNLFKIYGGTFVGVNPAWGDEGCMLPTTPNYLRPWSYYQGALLDGQEYNENGIVLPDGYEITKGATADGRPTYTVEYNK